MRVEWVLPDDSPEGVRSATIRSVDQLDELLDNLDAGSRRTKPMSVDLVSQGGSVLTVVLGMEESALAFQASPDPPYFASVGNENRQGIVVFFHGGHWTEFLARTLIPTSDAREAASRFFDTGGARPENVRWEEV